MKGISPTGFEIVGTLETVTGKAHITFCDSCDAGSEAAGKLSYRYTGQTDFFLDEQKPVTKEGKMVFLDDAGGEWTEDQIALVPDCYGEGGYDVLDECATCDAKIKELCGEASL